MSVFDYLSKKASDDLNKRHPWVNSKPVKKLDQQENSADYYNEQNKHLDESYKQKKVINDQGMLENAPETPEEKQSREKRERNQRLISGIGTAINGVAGMISGFSGGYAFPEEDKKSDPVETNIDKAKAERIARAQRYYNFSQANNKALEEYMKAKKSLKDQKTKGDISDAQLLTEREKARYWGSRADDAEVMAGDRHGLNEASNELKRKQGNAAETRAEKAGTTGGTRSAGRSTDNPDNYPFITSSNGRRVTFKTTKHQDKAYEAAERFVPREKPYYDMNPRTGKMEPKGTVSQRVSQFAQHPDSEAKQEFWEALESYSVKSEGAPAPKKKAGFPNQQGKSGSGKASQSGGPGITL